MKFGICIPCFGESAYRIKVLLETIEQYTGNYDYEVFVRDDATPELELVNLTEQVAKSAGATFLRGEEWGRSWENFHELGLYAISRNCDVIIYINDDCLMSQGWLIPIAYYYEWNEKIKPGMVSGVMIESWELAMDGIISDYEFYRTNFRDWSNNGTLLREDIAFSQESFDLAVKEERIKTVGTYHPMGPIVDGKFKLTHPVPLTGGLGPYFTIRADAFQEVDGFRRCEFTGDYEAMIGMKVWEAGFKCCLIPSPPAYHVRGVASQQSYYTHPEETWDAYIPWTEAATARFKERWPFDSMHDAIKHCERTYQNPASEILAHSRFIGYQSERFPINVVYDRLDEISLGPIGWGSDIQKQRMNWIARQCFGSVLDIGCANGGLVDFIPEDAVNDYVGVDFDRVRIDEACNNYPNHKFYVLDVAYGLPFLFDSFDVVVAADILEHIPYERAGKLLLELTKVVKKRILITLPLSEETQRNVDHVWVPSVDKVQEFLKPVEQEWRVEIDLSSDFILVHLETLNV